MGPSLAFATIVDATDGDVWIRVRGELDIDTVPKIEEHLELVERWGPPSIVFDLTDVTFLESSAVHAFSSARARADAVGRRLVLFGARECARRVFELTGTQMLLAGDEGLVTWSERTLAAAEDPSG